MKRFSSLIRKYKTKKIVSIGAMIGGVILIIFTKALMYKVAEAKGTIDSATGLFSRTGTSNPMTNFFGGIALAEASKYDLLLMALLLIGIVLVFFGIINFFWHGKK